MRYLLIILFSVLSFSAAAERASSKTPFLLAPATTAVYAEVMAQRAFPIISGSDLDSAAVLNILLGYRVHDKVSVEIALARSNDLLETGVDDVGSYTLRLKNVDTKLGLKAVLYEAETFAAYSRAGINWWQTNWSIEEEFRSDRPDGTDDAVDHGADFYLAVGLTKSVQRGYWNFEVGYTSRRDQFSASNTSVDVNDIHVGLGLGLNF